MSDTGRRSFTQEQLRAFSECLAQIYQEPVGEDPVEAILDAIERLVRADSIAVDEMKGDGERILRHRHLAHRRPELMETAPEIVPVIARDHPMIQHVLHHGPSPCMKLSDFVTQRQLRSLSLYSFNSRNHEWRDQAALVSTIGAGTLSFALNRDRVFSDGEFALLQMLQPHIQRVLSRCAWFVRLPGVEQLTCREREVLYWITQGKQDPEIALILHCAERTVRQHTRAILRKLCVENRTSAICAVLSGRAHDSEVRGQLAPASEAELSSR